MNLVTAQEMRNLDKKAMEEFAVSGLLLMEHAAKAIADAVWQKAQHSGWQKAVVVCGKGNNGGDGFGAARWLLAYGMQVQVLLVQAKKEDLKGDAQAQMQMFLQAGGRLQCVGDEHEMQLAEVICLKADVIIDAMLGTGFYGELSGLWQQMCRILNGSGKYLVAADVPTGIDADSGMAANDAVKADCTVTMGLVKTGLVLYPAKNYVGELVLADIGFPEKMLEEGAGKKYLLTDRIVRSLLPLRKGNAHKGDAGRIVLAAGSQGYTGAAALSSYAAVKAGGGLVSLLTPLSCRDVLSTKLTEVMVHGLLERMPGILGGGAATDIVKRANAADVLAVGPGLGTSDSTMEVVRDVLLKAEVPVVIDADALTALQGHLDILTSMQAPKVLTPHPGEMARLLSISAEQADRERITLAEKYAVQWQAVVVLKGAPTVIGCPDGSVYVNTTGTNAMATGGSGDVLTGIIAGLAGQEISLQEAALCGVYLHGLAGELAAAGSIGLAAGQISDYLPQARKMTETVQPRQEFIYNYALNVIK